MIKKLILNNVPNILSGYRIVALPFITFCIVYHYRDAFFILIMVNLVTDILDGLIARTFKLETEFGAKLDSTADIGTYLCAIIGFVVMENEFLSKNIIWFYFLIGLYVLAQIISIIKFKRNTHYHLYSNKITGYLQGLFFLFYYLEIYSTPYFYFMMIFSCLAYLESIIVTIFIKKLRSNVKGIYFMLKEYGRIQ